MKKLLLLIMGILLMGCSVLAKESLSLESMKSKGTIIVGTCADYPPYEFHKEIDGQDEIVGFDISLAKAIAEDLEMDLQVVDMSFDGLLPALMAGKIDFIAAGMTPTEERKNSVDFSSIYYDTDQTMLVLKENLDKYQDIKSFEGVKIGVQKASLQEAIFDDYFEGAEKVALGKISNLIMELQSGKVEAIILAEVVASQYASVHDDLALNGLDLGSEGGVAIALRKDQKKLLTSINQTIKRLKDSGELDQIILEAMNLMGE